MADSKMILPPPLTPPLKGEGDSATVAIPLPLEGRSEGWGYVSHELRPC